MSSITASVMRPPAFGTTGASPSPTPRNAAGSTRGSRHVTTKIGWLGIIDRPVWAPVVAKARLRSRSGSRFVMGDLLESCDMAMMTWSGGIELGDRGRPGYRSLPALRVLLMAEELPELIVTNAAAWREWLTEHCEGPAGVWLVLAKKGTTHPTSLTYDQTLDEALCHGWIDGQTRRRDEATYSQRFTPRRTR